MLRKLEPRGTRVVTLAVLVTVATVLSSPPTKAQSTAWTPAYPMILTPERAWALVQAADQGLDYVPGEVLVKFKAGVTAASQQRALQALRSRPALTDLRWIGDTALVTDGTEPDATILASRLDGEPEVEYAEPNYLRHRTSTPNDPSFTSRQWNFSAIDLPRAWDINGGANGSVTVAVIDFG